MKFLAIALATALIAAPALPAAAANVDIQLLNKGEAGAMTFQPDLVKVGVGDTVTFQPTDKGHNVDIVANMLPAGAQPFKGDNSRPLTETFTVPGIYVVKCDPHYGMGMVAVIVVGDDLSNLDAVKAGKNPKLAQQRLDTIFADLAK
ncbi:MAG TPA: pseudoazurin [Devosia sp.]|jgi:pseudoazurin|nr:pseudoazurin [Devosia sp.]